MIPVNFGACNGETTSKSLERAIFDSIKFVIQGLLKRLLCLGNAIQQAISISHLKRTEFFVEGDMHIATLE